MSNPFSYPGIGQMLNKMSLVQEMLAVWYAIRNEEQVLWTDLGTYSSPCLCLEQILYIDSTQIHGGTLRRTGGSSVGIHLMTSDSLQAQMVSACSEM